jgi:lysophospholipase L1-like esterase
VFLVIHVLLRNDSITNYPPKNSTIVAFGDSLVSGVGATSGHDFVSVLGKRIGKNIVNLGVPGNTTADGVLRMHEVVAHDPGIVLLLLGGNDTLRRIPQETTEANLRVLIEGFLGKGAVVVLIGVRGGIIGTDREYMYERVADTNGVVYIEDILDGIFLTPELMHDGIHPNDAGYARIADRIFGVLREHNLVP